MFLSDNVDLSHQIKDFSYMFTKFTNCSGKKKVLKKKLGVKSFKGHCKCNKSPALTHLWLPVTYRGRS